MDSHFYVMENGFIYYFRALDFVARRVNVVNVLLILNIAMISDNFHLYFGKTSQFLLLGSTFVSLKQMAQAKRRIWT